MPHADFRKPARRRRALVLESLEGRAMLSVVAAAPPTTAAAAPTAALSRRTAPPIPNLDTILWSSELAGGATNAAPTPFPGAYGAGQLRTAYGANLLSNQGQGVTVAIIDRDVDPNLIPDANVYSAQYGLPIFNSVRGPKLSSINDTQFATTVPNSSKNPNTGDGDTSSETSLDVDMVHAMAPQASIVLIFFPSAVSDANYSRNLLHAIQLGAQQPGVVAVSVSYGLPEIGGSTATAYKNNNTTFLTQGAASLVPVAVSSGDSGNPPDFPATSPNVVAVGGTGLYLGSARGSYSFETAWGGYINEAPGGGGVSTIFAAPAFQTSNGVTGFSGRAVPDISLNADVLTAASIYDSWDQNYGTPWNAFGGTSEATPLFAGILALVQQDRIMASKPLLTSAQVDSQMYAAYDSSSYSTYFHDVVLGTNNDFFTQGNNLFEAPGFGATTGYDLATGIGSPKANALVPYLTLTSASQALPGGGGLALSPGSGLGSDSPSLLGLTTTNQDLIAPTSGSTDTDSSDPLAGPNGDSLVLPAGRTKKNSLLT